MEKIGRRRMCSIVSNETGLPYRDIAAYGCYKASGFLEILQIGAYELRRNMETGYMVVYEPDYSEGEPKFVYREVRERTERRAEE